MMLCIVAIVLSMFIQFYTLLIEFILIVYKHIYIVLQELLTCHCCMFLKLYVLLFIVCSVHIIYSVC